MPTFESPSTHNPNSLGKKLSLAVASFAAVLLMAFAVPSMASADTAVPPLPSGGTQAFANPFSTPRHFSGPLTLTSSTGLQVTCTLTITVTYNSDGTNTVTVANFSGCGTNVSGCTVPTASAVNLTWRSRFVWIPSNYYDHINVEFSNTFAGSCPFPTGQYTFTGLLTPTVTGGTPGTVSFPAGTSGSVSNPNLGSATVSGTLNGTAGEATTLTH